MPRGSRFVCERCSGHASAIPSDWYVFSVDLSIATPLDEPSSPVHQQRVSAPGLPYEVLWPRLKSKPLRHDEISSMDGSRYAARMSALRAMIWCAMLRCESHAN